MTDEFAYNDGKSVIPKDTFRISPSQMSKFFDSTSEWYRTMLLDEEGFNGNTATHLGNCVHVAAEMYTKTQTIDHAIINTYINSIDDPEVDKEIIRFQYPVMVQALVSGFLSKQSHSSAETEQFVVAEVLPGVVVGGSIDRYDPLKAGGTVTDYKSMGSLDKVRLPTRFARAYFFQQLTYAWALIKAGRPVSQVELIFVTRHNTGRVNDKGKPLKDYPSTVHRVFEPVTDENMDFIESVLKTIAESVLLWKSNPEYKHILAQDYRLKEVVRPKLFK